MSGDRSGTELSQFLRGFLPTHANKVTAGDTVSMQLIGTVICKFCGKDQLSQYRRCEEMTLIICLFYIICK